jgi:protein-disulfide isomerase
MMRDQASKEFQLEGTPTFYVNGKKVGSSPNGWLAQIKAEIDPLLAA